MEKIPTDSLPTKQNGSITRCRRTAPQKTTQRTEPIGCHAFLTHPFTPLIDLPEEYSIQRDQMETAFFQSLKYFCHLYGIQPLSPTIAPFPLNIVKAYQQANAALQEIEPDLELIIVADHTHASCLATVQCFPTGHTLYYLPIRPLVDLLQTKHRKREQALLLSIFSYLYNSVHIPWFHDVYTYLSDTYEHLQNRMEDYSEEDEEEQPYAEQLEDFQQLKEQAPIIKKLLQEPQHLLQFKQRLKAYRPTHETGKRLKEVAENLYNLYQLYPTQTIIKSIPENVLSPEKEDRIRLDQYISFIWDERDAIFDTMIEQINYDLQECDVADEPLSLQLFDKPQFTNTHNLHFENTLFTLLIDFSTLLNEIV